MNSFLIKSSFWIIGTTVVCACQAGLMYLGGSIVVKENMSLWKLIQGGMLAFYTTAIVSAVVLDYYVSRLRFSWRVESFACLFVPFVLLASALVLFGFGYGRTLEQIKTGIFYTSHVVLIGFTALYVLVLKAKLLRAG